MRIVLIKNKFDINIGIREILQNDQSTRIIRSTPLIKIKD